MNKRYIGVDLVKCIAILFVISVHFFLNTTFYSTEIVGNNMFLQLNLRWLFLVCVPLFLISTGFLQSDKGITKKHYINLIPILIQYVIISIISIFFKYYQAGMKLTLIDILKGILHYNGNGYSWYIEMFIGLYLLIPFLNLVYKNINNRKHKLLLITILILLCSIGYFNDYWVMIYPILYYYIGSYIKEYRPTFNRKLLIVIALFIVNLESVITAIYAIRMNNHIFTSLFDSYANILTLLISILIFLIFYDIEIKSTISKKCITEVSGLTLSIYLFSFIYDLYFYIIFKDKYYITQQDFFKYIIVIVPLIFFFSYISAYIYSFCIIKVKKIFNIKINIIRKRGENN